MKIETATSDNERLNILKPILHPAHNHYHFKSIRNLRTYQGLREVWKEDEPVSTGVEEISNIHEVFGCHFCRICGSSPSGSPNLCSEVISRCFDKPIVDK